MNTLNLTLFPYCLIIKVEIHLSRKKMEKGGHKGMPQQYYQILNLSDYVKPSIYGFLLRKGLLN